MPSELIQSDRKATILGGIVSLASLITIALAMFAPVDPDVKMAAIASTGAVGSVSSIGIANSNRLTSAGNSEKGQP